MALLDGKYSVVREVSSADGLTVYETRLPGGETARVDWFTVNDPKTRSLFHQYRTALKVIGSPLLIDAVIRPGVYYSAWWPSEAPDAGGYLADHPRDQKVRERLEEMAETLAAYGFALRDASLVVLNGGPAPEPCLAGLNLISRPADEIRALNDETLGKPARAARRGRAPRPVPARTGRGAPATAPAVAAPAASPTAPTTAAVPTGRPGPVGGSTATVVDTAVRSGSMPVVKPHVPTPQARPSRAARAGLAAARVLPGLAMLAVTALVGVQSVSAYLEPGVVRVPGVIGQSSAQAWTTLQAAGLSVTASKPDGNDPSQRPGVVLSQDPPAGQQLHRSRFVTLQLNRPQTPGAPDRLLGSTLEDATTLLAEEGLKVGNVLYAPAMPDQPVTDQARLGRVMGQYPPPGAPATSGTVDLLVAVNPTRSRETFLPDLTGLDWKTAKGLVELSGLGVTSYRERESSRPPGTVIGQDPAPNAAVGVGGSVTLTLAIARAAPPPSRPAAPTPEPVVPTPVTPVTPDTTTTPPDSAVTTPPATTTTPDTTAGGSTPGTTAPATNPTTPPASTAGSEMRDFSYLLPVSSGPRTVQVRVRDAQGERVVYQQPTQGGVDLVVSNVPTWGNGEFSLFIDGQEIIEARSTFTGP